MQRVTAALVGLAGTLGSWVSCMAAETAEQAGEHKPELISFDPATAIWVLVVFIVMLAVLYPTAWRGVLAGLKAREERIRKEIADAEAARTKAEATLAEYNRKLAEAEGRVRDMLSRAQGDAERLATAIREKAAVDSEGIKAKALADIEDAGKAAVAQVHEQAVELSTLIAEKIIRRNLKPEDQRELVNSSLQQLEAAKRN